MEDYKSMCKQIQDKVKRITGGRSFFANYAITIDGPASKNSREFVNVPVEEAFFFEIYKVAGRLLDLLDKEDGKAEPIEMQHGCNIKDGRDKALMNLYRHFNDLTGEKIIVGKLGPMHEVLNAIEKLEHARHMEMSDEVAKLSIEKLEKLASPMPTIKMSGIPKEFRDDLRKCGKKEGSKNDD